MKRTLFTYGGQLVREFVQYTRDLTAKTNPKICFLPTASADNQSYTDYFIGLCEGLNVRPSSMSVWVSSHSHKQTFEEILLEMDAIIVGGGNTLNMLAIWKAQGIDKVLRKAYDKGVVLAGGSAGSMCWFKEGTSDSRPAELSNITGLHFLDYSHCPHYHSEASRKPLYHQNILDGIMSDGYACDDFSGIVFINEKAEKVVSLDADNNAYFVYREEDEVKEKMLLPVEIIY
ncbi:MAG: peptidase E [Cyclobacteriaceae bacterium]